MQDNAVFIQPSRATGDIRFDLVLRTRELKQLEKVLKQVHDLPSRDKTQWVADNGPMLSQAYDQFVSYTSRTLEDISMDDEVLSLSKELVATLRDTSELLEGLVGSTPRLRS